MGFRAAIFALTVMAILGAIAVLSSGLLYPIEKEIEFNADGIYLAALPPPEEIVK